MSSTTQISCILCIGSYITIIFRIHIMHRCLFFRAVKSNVPTCVNVTKMDKMVFVYALDVGNVICKVYVLLF